MSTIDYKATAGYGKPFVRPMDKERKFGEWRSGKHAANPAEAQALVAEIDQLKSLLADSVPYSTFNALAEEKGAEIRAAAAFYKDAKELLAAERARANALERMVAELSGLLRDVKEAIPSWQLDGVDLDDRITAALASTVEVAGRWCPAAERDAAIADRNRACDAREAAERDRFKGALNAINVIRNSIVQRQTVNWSAHIYPLVTALKDAGIEGDDYDQTRARAQAEIEEIKAAVFTEVTAERDALRAEVARLTAEMEAMREVVEEAHKYRNTTPDHESSDYRRLGDALRALDALRARKVGG